MVYDTEDPTLIAKMNHEMREIESMEIVGVLKYMITLNSGRGVSDIHVEAP